ncbi:MAG: acetylxylan esterase [Lentisphaerae bacterium]|nr:acetylxylan esterase [Lentisphaerota bacterium]
MKKLSLLAAALFCSVLPAVENEVNYDESAVKPYTLPALLECKDGRKITTAAEWEKFRRPEILADYTRIMYGELPAKADDVVYELLSETEVLDNTAIRRELRLVFTGKTKNRFFFDMIYYIPKNAKGKVPVFIGLNFKGNHSIEADPTICFSGLNGLDDPLNERGKRSYRFPLKTIISRGYAIATACYHDLFPDRADGWSQSCYKLFYDQLKNPPHEKHTAIGAWSWGISRMLDYLEKLPEIDASRAAVFGHSRLGKTALWTGVNDTRFKLVCVNDAGEGGSALARRNFGETLYSMCFLRRAPGSWWFTSNLKPFAKAPHTLPFDQHMLMALAAPRSLAVHSATEDLWADPKGEYLSAYHAGEVYKLYGKSVLTSENMPAPETPAGGDVSYFLRTGKHDLLTADWLHYLDVADKTFKRK